MRLNDIELETQIRTINREIPVANLCLRDGKEHQLFLQLMLIRSAADDAMTRLNRLRFEKKETASA